MEFNVDIQNRGAANVSSLEPSQSWVLGLARDDASSAADAAVRPYSYLAECECPDNCQRDHENE